MEFRVLGPLEVVHEGSSIPLGSRKQRALLAILLLRANEVVPFDTLIDELWGERPPPTAMHTLQVYVSRLRAALRRSGVGDGVLVTRPAGYLLQVGLGELDLNRFEQLAAEGRGAFQAGAFGRASAKYTAALALWRGRPLSDLAFEPFARIDVERLEERRLAVIEDRIDADLALGKHAFLVSELEALVAQYPLRERVRGQLMLALYRSGRQADALDAYREARLHLVGELGLEPSKALRALEQAVLRQDESLEPQDGHGRVAVLTAPEPPGDTQTEERATSGRAEPARGRAGSRWWAAAAAAAVMLAAAAVAVGLTRRADPPPSIDLRPTNQLTAVDARSGAIEVAHDLPGAPADVASGPDAIWIAAPDSQSITRVDPVSGSVIDRIQVPGQPGRVAVGAGAVWVASTLSNRISRVDPATGRVTQTVHLSGSRLSDIVIAGGAVWVADSSLHAVIEIDPRTGAARRRLPLDVAPAALAADRDVIWAAGYDAGVIEQIDRRSGRVVATVAVGQGPSAIAISRDGVWVANSLDATVSKVDPVSGSVTATIPVPSGPSAIAALPDAIWVASEDAGTLTRIDPRRTAVVSSRPVGGRPQAIASSRGRVWLASSASGGDHRGGTLTLVWTGRFATTDPAFTVESDRQFTRLAYDTLVTFRAAAGPAGLRLLPDLAVSIPRPTNGGTTYRFRIRPGIKYSDGRPVRARDFARAIERLFRVGSPGASYYSDLLGAPACMRRPRQCRLERGIETDDVARTVVFRLRVPDPDFLAKLTVLGFSTPIPPDVPDRDVGAKAIPGTGPYRFGAVTARELRFTRNPFFREWSAAAQPQGNPDAIVWRSVPTQTAATREVEQGRADWLFDLAPAAELRALRLRYPSQLHANPTTSVAFIALNTQRPPFDDVRVRRALNYAVDRNRIARLYGGSSVAVPLCQPLAPGLPGYRSYCPYTRRPRSDGRWSGPDLARARSLVRSSGSRGERVDVWGGSDWGTPTEVPRYIAQVLRSLGYRVHLHLVPFATITQAMRRDIQISVDGNWMPDYPAASAYLPQFFGCHGGNSNGYYCDPALDRRMARAVALQLTNPSRAASQWAAIDRELVDRAAWVPTVNLQALEFVSKRVQNYQYSPVGGFIAHQARLP